MTQTSQTATGSLEDQRGEETTDVASAFANETSKARTLALEHGKLWEFLIVEELLKSKLQDLKKEWNNLDNEVQSISKKQLSSREFLSWLTGAMDELGSLGAKIGKCIKEELLASLGKPGVSGDAITMLKTVEGLFGYFRGFLTFERDLHAADPPAKLKVFGVAFQGIAGSAIDIAEQLTNEWSQAVDRIQAGSHEFNIKVQFDLPQVHKAAAEMEKVQRNSQLYL